MSFIKKVFGRDKGGKYSFEANVFKNDIGQFVSNRYTNDYTFDEQYFKKIFVNKNVSHSSLAVMLNFYNSGVEYRENYFASNVEHLIDTILNDVAVRFDSVQYLRTVDYLPIALLPYYRRLGGSIHLPLSMEIILYKQMDIVRGVPEYTTAQRNRIIDFFFETAPSMVELFANKTTDEVISVAHEILPQFREWIVNNQEFIEVTLDIPQNTSPNLQTAQAQAQAHIEEETATSEALERLRQIARERIQEVEVAQPPRETVREQPNVPIRIANELEALEEQKRNQLQDLFVKYKENGKKRTPKKSESTTTEQAKKVIKPIIIPRGEDVLAVLSTLEEKNKSNEVPQPKEQAVDMEHELSLVNRLKNIQERTDIQSMVISTENILQNVADEDD